MNAVERINYFVENLSVLDSTTDSIELDCAYEWPSEGKISFENVEMRYRPELPSALVNLSFDIKAGEKMGIVGRTGSGKSSLTQVLLRMVEIENGTIKIDGINIRNMPLSKLRQSIAMIPQDPVLFAETVRFNLDPENRFTDHQIWQALEKVNLKSGISFLGGLDAKVELHGANLSVGQRQLICLARALLLKAKIIIMDEATASMDFETDLLIQQTIHSEFADCTVLCIAHRLDTVISYDRILVLQQGQLVEIGTPKALLDKEDGMFTSMVNETGEKNASFLRSIVNSAVVDFTIVL